MRRALLALLVTFLAAPAAAGAQTPPPGEPRIPPGAKAAGQDVGNLTLEEAAARLDGVFSKAMRRSVEVRVAGERVRAPMKQLDLVFDPMRTARRANIAARAVAPGPDGTHAVDVPLYTTWSAEKLAAFAKKVDRRSRIRPRNARLEITLTRMIRHKAHTGWSIDAAGLAESVAQVLQDPLAIRVVRATRERVKPEIGRADLARRHPTVVTIDRSNFRLRLFKRLRFSKSYGIAVGAPGYETPTGQYSITNKAVNPAWSAPDRPWAGAYRNEVVEGGSAENPLKARWLGIVNGVGIHGTAAEYSIGTRASHGCIRMRVADVIDLYPRVPVGATVLIR
jgi:lipoprotein-anchoring transpeptidase ErfK/SrfK